MGAFIVQHTVLQRMNSSPEASGDSQSGPQKPGPQKPGSLQPEPQKSELKKSETQKETQKSEPELSQPKQFIKQLKQLVQETCQHAPGSPRRQRGMTQLIRLMTPKLWHAPQPYYADALQQTWIFFCRNLCEATTGKVYNPEVASPVTWLNSYLKHRLHDFQIAENRQRATTLSQSSFASFGEEGTLDPIDRLPAPPDIPTWLEQVRAWAQQDPSGELATTHVSKHPSVTAQLLILKRLPPETPWKVLAADHGISVGTLSSFYQRQCLTRLRSFGKSQGYF
ncbi:MAG: sigma-70 family RNA polymerase sigma factor [Cyanobacteria bacterium J06634_5]